MQTIKKFKHLFIQLFRFGIVGGLAFIIDYTIMLVLVEKLELGYLLASAIAFCIATIFNYILSITWVFTDKKEHKKGVELAVFVILSLLGLAINALMMWLCTDQLAIDYRISKIIATAIVMVWNFVTRKIFLEKGSA